VWVLGGSHELGEDYDSALPGELFDERKDMKKKDKQLEQSFCVYADRMARRISTFTLPPHRTLLGVFIPYNLWIPRIGALLAGWPMSRRLCETWGTAVRLCSIVNLPYSRTH
jgi:hypothetical protein